jgi:hypothetical protein
LKFRIILKRFGASGILVNVIGAYNISIIEPYGKHYYYLLLLLFSQLLDDATFLLFLLLVKGR